MASLKTLLDAPDSKATSMKRSFGLSAFALRKFLAIIDVGRIEVELPSGDRIEHVGAKPGPRADIRFHSWRALRRLVTHGDIGFAEGYLDGEWTSRDIVALIELGGRNGSRLLDAMSGWAPFRLFNWLAHRGNANTKAGSRRNIAAHYDLGNEFYRLWLDRGMMYSSAIFSGEGQSLEEAQDARLARIVEKLNIEPAASVLEIGCGWGGLAATISRTAVDCVTSVTISPSQLAEAQELARAQDFDDKVEFRLQDYRDITGRFDRIVSIEMVEAVGRGFMPGYFETIRDRLKPGGLCVLQAITIAEDRFALYCRRPDFIQRFVFPGGFLPSKTFLRETLERAGLELVAAENFGDSYALTLREWRMRFLEAWPRIERLGFDAPFKRLWEYYLCYCEAGFRTGMVDVGLYSIRHARG
jgi:cyclopropane-fatty-acyl-phospholipid synthase